MSQRPDNANPLDPFGAWRQMRDANVDAWSKMMIDLVNSEDYSRATGQWLDAYLAMSQPFQKAIEAAMTRTLEGLNMPTRADVISLAERLTNIELRLDDLDARLDEARGTAAKGREEPLARPEDATGAAASVDAAAPDKDKGL